MAGEGRLRPVLDPSQAGSVEKYMPNIVWLCRKSGAHCLSHPRGVQRRETEMQTKKVVLITVGRAAVLTRAEPVGPFNEIGMLKSRTPI